MSTRNRGQKYSCVFSPLPVGFSLIELILALAITAILASLVSPAISSWIESTQAKTVQQQIASLLSEARYRALSKAETLTICHLEMRQCSGDFRFPLSTFVDANRDAIWDADEILLHQASTDLPASARLSWNRKGGFVRFWPNGGTGALTGSISYCHSEQPTNDFRIVVARTGRLRIDKKATRCNQFKE